MRRVGRARASGTLEQRAERDLALEPRQRRTQAEVRAEAEREVAVVAARDVEAVGLVEHRRVAVRRADAADHERALPDRHAAELHVLERDAHGALHRAVEAQHLLDRALQQLGLRAQARELVGVLQERERPVPDQVRGRLVTGEQQQDRGRQQLAVAERVAVLLRRDERADQVVARLARGARR